MLLEEDCRELFKCIEPCSKNGTTFGPALSKLLLACGSEVDVVLKELFEWADPIKYWQAQRSKKGFSKRLTINDYKSFVREEREWSFRGVEVGLISGDWSVTPWNSLWYAEPESPDWWNAYNNVKHHRAEKYSQATLKATFQSLAALFICVVDLARVLNVERLLPTPNLLVFSDSQYGETAFAEMCGTTLHMDTALSFHAKSDVSRGLITEGQLAERESLRDLLSNMKSEERLLFLDSV